MGKKTVIDSLMSGAIDMHVHYDKPWLHRLYLANGVTTVRDLGSSVERMTTLRQEIAVGNILAPRLFISGMPINPRTVRAMGLESSAEMAAKLAEAGVDGIKVTGYNAEELREIVQVAHNGDEVGDQVDGGEGVAHDARGQPLGIPGNGWVPAGEVKRVDLDPQVRYAVPPAGPAIRR